MTSSTQTGLLVVVAAAAIVAPAVLQSRSQARLNEENMALHREVAQLSRVSEDNERLSNLVTQAKSAQGKAEDQFRELIRVRAELAALKEANASNHAAPLPAPGPTNEEILQELAKLRSQVTRLTQDRDDVARLRDQFQQLRATASQTSSNAAPEQAAPSTAETPAPADETPMALRIIRTQGPTWAEKLKKAVGAQENDAFEDVFARFLQANGVSLQSIAAAVYDDRTGRVIVRATPAALDQIEKLTTALDNAP